MVYGKDTLFPLSLEIPALQLLKSIEVAENGPMDVRLVEIMELEEVREAAFVSLQNRQQTIKKWFDNKKSSDPELKQGGLVLKYNERVAKPGLRPNFNKKKQDEVFEDKLPFPQGSSSSSSSSIWKSESLASFAASSPSDYSWSETSPGSSAMDTTIKFGWTCGVRTRGNMPSLKSVYHSVSS
ncbi:uncharacterized protein LOC131050644 [Cryptomeria japonica]|uniref:uncharacterized protein LOC131050644 n=1 Tax=Cryptomeria japonica TaxID=3369 RepID=UPI0025ACA020|nr:uncharacterized protein LOC131050644 [Cryptomeria japonica]